MTEPVGQQVAEHAPGPPPEAPIASPPAAAGASPIGELIFSALAEMLGVTREEAIVKINGVRDADKFSLPGATYEFGKPFPGLADSIILGLFKHSTEGSAPGDLRIYVAPSLAATDVEAVARAGGKFFCYTIHRGSLSQLREPMAAVLFVEEMASEWALRIDPDDGEDDEAEGEMGCDLPGCEAEVTAICGCAHCKDDDDGAVLCCATHRVQVGKIHISRYRQPPMWISTGEEGTAAHG